MAFKYSPISTFRKSTFAASNGEGHIISHDIYQRGEGPPIVLIQELPGIGTETLRLADRLIDSGFEVVLPHLFGPLEKTNMVGNLARVFCMRREFRLFESNKSSPIVDWLKALCADVRASRGVPGVGVIGMCLTGNFAISLMGDDSVLAAVAAQPAMPLHKQDALHMSEQEVAATKRGIEQSAPMHAFRFAGDKMCSAEKFNAIVGEFNSDGQERVVLTTLPGEGHSVFTLDFVDDEGHPTRQALDSILEYFTSQLAPNFKTTIRRNQ
jgi:dienelactone hydrolase